MVMTFTVILSLYGCGGSSSVSKSLDTVESLMESRPDSALAILDSIRTSDLDGKSQKARYALLKSMALDKNYVDTTTFDVLQPAINHYLQHGTPDDKIRTYFYQGRIYQNRHDQDSALHSFMRGLDVAEDCSDSLTIARTLVAEAIVLKKFYDIEGYANNYLKAAEIYKSKQIVDLELDCLLNALNGMIILENEERADSIFRILDTLDSFNTDNTYQQQLMPGYRLSYILQFGSKQDLYSLIVENEDKLCFDVNSILNIAKAYNRLGDNRRAIQYLNYIDEINVGYDTLKYLSTRLQIFEDIDNYKEALYTYKKFINRLETINSTKIAQKNQSIEEKHQMELQSEKDAARHLKILLSCIGGMSFLMMAVIILMLAVRSSRIKKDLAMQKAISVELENEKLKSENELANEKAMTAELENGKLKAENELSQQKARTAELENENLKTEKEKLTLENRNLQLERDNKALEAENLAHRVAELERESADLKEVLESQKEMPPEVRKAIQTRIEMLNSYLASQISDHKEFEKAYDTWVAELTANTEEFMNSNRLAFQASHPRFIEYFEAHGLTTAEINYVCLYAIGLRGKDVGSYMKRRSHVNDSSAIRKKLGIDRHETNIGIYVRKLLKEL